MAKVSIIIPSRNERFLDKTVDDVFRKAFGEIEVVVILDGYDAVVPIIERPNLIVIRTHRIGMRRAISMGANLSSGKYLMKSDAHCMFSEGFDEILKADCDDNWVVVPRRYSLDAEEWSIRVHHSAVDYHYIIWPWKVENEASLRQGIWKSKFEDKRNILIDDEMTSQGSCWFMTKDHFWNRIEGLSDEGYGGFGQEFIQIGNMTWLGGGRVVVNKKCWYAHLHKGRQYGRGFTLIKDRRDETVRFSLDYWINNRWKERKYDFEWLIDKFWPVPTWPEDWEELLLGRRNEHLVYIS